MICRVFFCQRKINLPVRNTKISKKIYKYIKIFEMTPLKTAKMTKMHHECPKYPKIFENDQNTPKTMTITPKTFKLTKIPLKPQK